MAPNDPEKPSKPNQRDLILEAINQATPRPDSVQFHADMPAEGTFPGYELLREIHRGGQGVVYQAIQKATKRKVALKVLHGGPFTGSAGRSRFEREVQVLGQLSHANIVALHDSGVTADGGFFYVMDYISGHSLEEYIAQKKLSVEESLRLFLKICDAVNAAHLKGIIHRDIKPANVRIDPNGEPIVVDFGLAKVAGPDASAAADGSDAAQLMTLTGQFIGSLPWASPEQAEGIPGNIDVRTDVYSLGVMFYQMLTGQFPYKVIGNMRDVLDNILRAEPAKPSTIRRQINDEVETIVLKCLAKDRERRYQTAGELARDLRHYIAGEPVEAKRDSTAYLLSKTLRRYRAAAAAIAVGLGALIAFAIVVSVLYRQSSAAEARALDALEEAELASRRESVARTRAEQNFKAGHTLAVTMLTDVENELDGLRGTTAARATLLASAREYLETLRTEAGDDPAILLDLARAHERVGDLQGVMYMRRTGDTDAAERNFARAREIRTALLTRLPDDPRVHAALARSHYRTAGLMMQRRQYDTAREEYARQIQAYDQALNAGPSFSISPATLDDWTLQRAWGVRAQGDCHVRLATTAEGAGDTSAARSLLQDAQRHYEAARIAFAGRVATEPNHEEASRGLAVMEDAHAAIALWSGRWLFNSAAKLAQAGSNPEAREQHLAALPRYEQARERSSAALAMFREVSALHPRSADARRAILISLHNIGSAHAEAADTHAALVKLGVADAAPREADARALAMNHYQQALAIARRVGDEDAANMEARRDLTLCLTKLGAELTAVKNFDAALPLLEEALRVRREILASDPMERHEVDVAVASFRLGDLHLRRGSQTPAPVSARDFDAAAEHVAQSTRLIEALIEKGALEKENTYSTAINKLTVELKKARALVSVEPR